MESVLNKSIVLKLNNQWKPIGVTTPKKIFGDLGEKNKDGQWKVKALHIEYPMNEDGSYNFNNKPSHVEMVDWDNWISLPVRECDFYVTTGRGLKIRVPSIVVATQYDDMPEITTQQNLKTIYELHEGICACTNKWIPYHEASIEHIVPLSRGGKNTWNNITLSHVEFNNKKGNKLYSELGMKTPKVIIPPKKKKMFELIKPRADIPEWKEFLIKK